jgi:hypothetical protein
MLAKPISANSAIIFSAGTPVYSASARCPLAIASETITFNNNLDDCSYEVLLLYPARTATCVALRSTRYSCTNRSCFCVSLPLSLLIGDRP